MHVYFGGEFVGDGDHRRIDRESSREEELPRPRGFWSFSGEESRGP